MNRKQRRDIKFGRTRLGRDRDLCEHGYWKKTDGDGNPMCPHKCGFE